MKKLPSHIYHFSGDIPGPCVVVMGGVHGNEKIGVQIIEALKLELFNEKICGEIYLIIGNPKAVTENKRFIDLDLNRLFGDDFSNSNYEEKRAFEIAEFLAKADFLLDIHSTIKKSIPFVYCGNTQKHFSLAKILATKYIVSPSLALKKTGFGACADNFVDRHGGVGLTYECGWSEDNSMFDKAFSKTKQFLKTLGVAFSKESLAKTSKQPAQLEIFSKIIAESKNFTFTNEYNNFDFINEEQKIATDGNKAIYAKKDSYIIFPKNTVPQNNTACFLATLKKS